MCVILVTQVAIACAIFGNGFNLMEQRFSLQRLESGLDENRVGVLDVNIMAGRLSKEQRQSIVTSISRMEKVESVAFVNNLPFDGGGSDFRFVSEKADGQELQVSGTLYSGSIGFMETLGIPVLYGQGFSEEDMFYEDDGDRSVLGDKIILSESLSRWLATSVGDSLRIGSRTLTVIGIAKDVMVTSLTSSERAYFSAFVGVSPSEFQSSRIIINAEEDNLSSALVEAVAVATRATPETYVWTASSFRQIRKSYFSFDREVARMVFGMSILVVVVVSVGVGGLYAYWIRRRHKDIAIRRALGARRFDISTYFRLENIIIVSIGVAFGSIFSVILNVLLDGALGLPPTSLWSMVASALLMLIAGQLVISVPVGRGRVVDLNGLR